VPINVTLKTAREVEDLLAKVIALAEGTSLIAPSILMGIKIGQRNVVPHIYKTTEHGKAQQ
jgi:hypothetical protein